MKMKMRKEPMIWSQHIVYYNEKGLEIFFRTLLARKVHLLALE